MLLSLFTTFSPNILVFPPNIFDKCTPVSDAAGKGRGLNDTFAQSFLVLRTNFTLTASNGSRTKWYGQNGMDKMVYRQNGIGQYGIQTKWYWTIYGMDKM